MQTSAQRRPALTVKAERERDRSQAYSAEVHAQRGENFVRINRKPEPVRVRFKLFDYRGEVKV